MPYTVDGKTLYMRMVELKGGKTQPIYFFSANPPKQGTPLETLPEGFEVVRAPRSNLPILRRIGGSKWREMRALIRQRRAERKARLEEKRKAEREARRARLLAKKAAKTPTKRPTRRPSKKAPSKKPTKKKGQSTPLRLKRGSSRTSKKGSKRSR